MKQLTKDDYGLPYNDVGNNIIMLALYQVERKLRERKMVSKLMQEKGKNTLELDKQNRKLRTAINTIKKWEGCYSS
jgi:hypothetical protein